MDQSNMLTTAPSNPDDLVMKYRDQRAQPTHKLRALNNAN